MFTEEARKFAEESYKNTLKSRQRKATIKKENEFNGYSFWSDKQIGDLFKLKFGDFFLYQTTEYDHIEKNNKMSYPKLATFIEYLPCDQTLELRFVNMPRTWMYKVEYVYDNEGSTSTVSERGQEIDYVIPWGNTEVYIFGKWNSMPDWKSLRRAYEKTMWYRVDKDEHRDRMIDILLK
jgi:hypothetical protein